MLIKGASMNTYYYFGLADDRTRAYPLPQESLRSMSYSEEEHGEHPVFNEFSKKIVGSLLFGKPILIDERSLIQQPNFLASLVKGDERIDYITPLLKNGYIKLLSNNGKFSEIPERLQKTRSMTGLYEWLNSHEGGAVLQGLKRFDSTVQKQHTMPFSSDTINGQSCERFIHRFIIENKIKELESQNGLPFIGVGRADLLTKEQFYDFRNRYEDAVAGGITFRTAWEDSLIHTLKYDIQDFNSYRQDSRIRTLMNFVNEARHKAYPLALGYKNIKDLVGTVTHESGIFSNLNATHVEDADLNSREISNHFEFYYSLRGVLENIDFLSAQLMDESTELFRCKKEFIDALGGSANQKILKEKIRQYENTLSDSIKMVSKSGDYKPSKLLQFCTSALISMGAAFGSMATTPIASPEAGSVLAVTGMVVTSLLTSGVDFVCQAKIEKIKRKSYKESNYNYKFYKQAVYSYEDILPEHVRLLRDKIRQQK